MGEKSLAPIVFGRSADVGYRVPHSWSHENCVVTIDVIDAGDKDVATFATVFKRAFDISVECVIKPPHLGGKARIGENKLLELAVIESNPRMHPCKL